MADIPKIFRSAISQARAGVSAAEQEAEKVLGRITDVAGFTPADVKRHARELGEKLQSQGRGLGEKLQNQRRELEKGIDEVVKKGMSRFQLPTRSEVADLRQRVDALTARVDALASERRPEA